MPSGVFSEFIDQFQYGRLSHLSHLTNEFFFNNAIIRVAEWYNGGQNHVEYACFHQNCGKISLSVILRNQKELRWIIIKSKT